MEKTRRLNLTIAFLILLMLFFSLVSNIPQKVTYAEETQYSNVLTDLQKDKSFKKNIYIENNADYSLRVIQVAESVDKELFIYVYQPSANTRKYIGTCVNMSVNSGGQKLYDLELLNSEGVFFKYKVLDLVVNKELEERTYDLTSIYRPFDAKVDTPPEDGASTITEISYAVGKLFKAKENEKGETIYDCTNTEVVKITDKFVGFVRYKDGYHLFPTYTACDSHFIAFDTDKDIEDLYSAKVTYSTQIVVSQGILGTNYGKIEKQKEATQTCTENVEYIGKSGWVRYKYEWNRIQTVNEFLKETKKSDIYEAGVFNVEVKNSITEKAEKLLESKKWILRFTETTYAEKMGSSGATLWQTTKYYTTVSNLSVIELTFKSEGQVFKLGVVDNKQTGSGKPANVMEEILSIKDGWIKWIFIIAMIVGILLLLFILRNPLKEIFGMVFKAVWWIITLPFEIFKD